MDGLPLVYIDTNVFLAYLLGKEKEPGQYPLAKAFLEGLSRGRQEGMLSHLVFMEILAVLRASKSKEYDLLVPKSQSQRLDYIIDGANELYNELVRKTLQVPELKYTTKLNSDLGSLLFDALQILTEMKGSVMFYDHCRNCNTRRKEKFFSAHRCIGTVDIIHVLLAKELGCKKFVSFDKGFEELKNDPRIQPVKIEVLKPVRTYY